MYVINSLYDLTANHVDLSDFEIFKSAIELASDHERIAALSALPTQEIKQRYSPAALVTTLSKRDASESVVRRVTLTREHASRCRRKFVCLDFDFDVGQEFLANMTIDELKSLAEELNTRLIIYPTISYPAKPRFRAVVFTARQMNSEQYAGAVRWLYSKLTTSMTDASEENIFVSRNLPSFNDFAQADAVFIRDNEDCTDISNAEFKRFVDVVKQEKAARAAELAEKAERSKNFMTARLNSRDMLIEGAKILAQSSIAKDYFTYWPLSMSIALAVVLKQIEHDDAVAIVTELASAGGNQQTIANWQKDNIRVLNASIQQVQSDLDHAIVSTKALATYAEFKHAFIIEKEHSND